jgi:hypothetical protein
MMKDSSVANGDLLWLVLEGMISEDNVQVE